jgi:hypothetical protein
LDGFLGDGVISSALWPAGSLDLALGGFYLWGNFKDEIYRKKPYMEEELQENIRREMLKVRQTEFQSIRTEKSSDSQPLVVCGTH